MPTPPPPYVPSSTVNGKISSLSMDVLNSRTPPMLMTFNVSKGIVSVRLAYKKITVNGLLSINGLRFNRPIPNESGLCNKLMSKVFCEFEVLIICPSTKKVEEIIASKKNIRFMFFLNEMKKIKFSINRLLNLLVTFASLFSADLESTVPVTRYKNILF